MARRRARKAPGWNRGPLGGVHSLASCHCSAVLVLLALARGRALVHAAAPALAALVATLVHAALALGGAAAVAAFLALDTPGLGDAIDRLARETPTTCPNAAWGYEPEQGRGWIQIAAGTTAEERSAAAAAFDLDMRRRGLVPIAPAFLR